MCLIVTLQIRARRYRPRTLKSVDNMLTNETEQAIQSILEEPVEEMVQQCLEPVPQIVYQQSGDGQQVYQIQDVYQPEQQQQEVLLPKVLICVLFPE